MSSGLSVPEPLAPLEELYHSVLSADCPSLTPAHSASLLRSCLYAQGAGESACACECASAPELQCVSLTVLEQLLCRLTVRRGGPDFHLFAEETWSLLQADVMGALLQQLNSEDLLVSHLSVTCASAAVIYQLHNTGSVNAEWSRWCIQTLHGPPGPPVDACVRSLTEVLRRLLKGAHYELCKKVLVEFDSSLPASCPRWLSADTGGGYDGRGSSVSLVVDLLEVLCACRSMCAHGATLSSPCLLGICSRELLALCSCSKPAVRRQVLLLLKRALVQRAGEDWLGGHQSQPCGDVSLLAHSVLRAAAEGELKNVPLEGMPFFGGTQTVSSGRSVDNVSLRALCLVLLKSMELQCQPNGSVFHAEPVPLALCLQSLRDILPMDSPAPPSGQPRHCCSRVSSVFGEQDDDMMEAAKALLCIFLHHRQQEPSQSTSLLLWACSLGLNPHCHFLLLLRSLAFDHRVLLDFLISTETCFLEYFVRYLRFLRTDPGGFGAACASVCLEQQQHGRDGGNRGCRGAGGAGDTGLAAGGAGQGCGVVLVDYSSSGESDTEEMERTGDFEGAQHRDSYLETAVRCLSLLRELIFRLHRKKLFPYNPRSLIKLLTEAEAGLKSVSIKYEMPHVEVGSM